jgi:magnesium transporter
MMELFYFDKTVKKGSVKDLSKLKDMPLWIDITNITKEEAELMKKTFNLHPLSSEDLFNSNVRIKIEAFNDYLFCVFHGITKKKHIELVELDFVLGKTFIISNHKKEIQSITELKNNNEKMDALFSKGVDFIFHKIVDEQVDNFFPVLETIDESIENIEEEVTRSPRPELLTKILKLKRLIVIIKRSAMPQREKLSSLAKREHDFISKKATPYFRDVYDHSIKVLDMIDNYREAIGSAFDAYMSAVSNNMNEVMKVLSIIATIALPLTVISGVYGTNFSNLPGSAFPYGFWLMISSMIFLCVFMIYFFKKRKWI